MRAFAGGDKHAISTARGAASKLPYDIATMKKIKLRLKKETLRVISDAEAMRIAGGFEINPRPKSVSCLACSEYPYICITIKPNGCPILP